MAESFEDNPRREQTTFNPRRQDEHEYRADDAETAIVVAAAAAERNAADLIDIFKRGAAGDES